MYKLSAIFSAALIVGTAQAQSTILEITFDSASTGAAPNPYTELAGDTIPAGSAVNLSDPTGPGDPDVAAGAIVDTAGLGYAGTAQGGNALQLGSGYEGYYVFIPNTLNDYTVELVVAFSSYPNAGAEFSLTNFISTGTTGDGHFWEVRSFSTFGDTTDELQLNTNNGGGEVGAADSNFVPSASTWYKVEIIHDSVADTLTLEIDDSVIETVSNTLADDEFQDLALGYWPNDADSNRSLEGAIDVIRIIDNSVASVSDWSLLQ